MNKSVTIYTRRSFDMAWQPETTTITSSPKTISDYETLQSTGKAIESKEKAIARRIKELAEEKKDLRELKRSANEELSYQLGRLKKRYGSMENPEAQRIYNEKAERYNQQIAQQEAIIEEIKNSITQAQQRYSDFASQYDQETISKAKAAAPKNYTRGAPVASLSDLKAEAQRQAADKELLDNVQKTPGIIKPGQLKSQYYSYKYGGGLYTSLGDGSYNGMTVRQTTAPYTDAKTGQRVDVRVNTPTPQSKTIFAIPLDQQNRESLRLSATSGKYRTVGEIFGSAMYTPNKESVPEVTPGKFTRSERLALKANTAYSDFQNASTPRQEAGAALRQAYYFGALIAVESKKNVKSFATGVAAGGLWSAGRTFFKRLTRTKSPTKAIVGRIGSVGMKIGGIGFAGAYAYSLKSRGDEIKNTPEGIERTIKAANVASQVGLETAGFTIGSKATSKAFPERAYATTPTGTAQIVSVRRNTMTVTGTSTKVIGVGAPTTKIYSIERFEGVRGIFGGKVRTVTTISKRGGITQEKFFDTGKIVTRQTTSSPSRMTVYNRKRFNDVLGRKRIEYIGENLQSRYGGISPFTPLNTRFRRQEKGFQDDTILYQRGRRVTTYGFAQRTGRNTYIIGEGTSTARIVSLSKAQPTLFGRTTSDVIKLSREPKLLYTTDAYKLYAPQQKINTFGKARSSIYGIRDTTLRTAPERVVQDQNLLLATRATLDTPLPLPGETNTVYPIKTLIAKKGGITTKIAYDEVFVGTITEQKLGSPVKIITPQKNTERRINTQLNYKPQRLTAQQKLEQYFKESRLINLKLENAVTNYGTKPSVFIKRNKYGIYTRITVTNKGLSYGDLAVADQRRRLNDPIAREITRLNRKLPEYQTEYQVLQSPQVLRRSAVVRVQRLSGRNTPSPMVVQAPKTILRPATRLRVSAPALVRTASNTRVVPRYTTVPRVASLPKVVSIQTPAIIAASKLSTTQLSTTRLSTTALTTTRLTQTRITTTPTTIIPLRGVPPPPIISPPGFFSLKGNDKGSNTMRRTAKQLKKYTPSLFAIGTGVKGKKPSKATLGFAIRPIKG